MTVSKEGPLLRLGADLPPSLFFKYPLFIAQKMMMAPLGNLLPKLRDPNVLPLWSHAASPT